jgi:hypothetical protein
MRACSRLVFALRESCPPLNGSGRARASVFVFLITFRIRQEKNSNTRGWCLVFTLKKHQQHQKKTHIVFQK